MASIRLGDVPTWLLAVGTTGTLAAALWQIGSERSRRRAQEAVLSAERHLAQARLIAGWPGVAESDELGAPRPIFLINGSSEPVYELVVSLVFVQGAGAPRTGEEWESQARDHGSAPWTTASILLPGRWRVTVADGNWTAMGFRAAAEVAFRDASGANWVRRGNGKLEELSEAPLERYRRFGLEPPYDFQTPEPEDG